MRVARRNLYQPKHPINACPFEAVYNGSWSKVDYFKIKEGKIIIHYEEHGFKTEEKIPVDNLRLSSRKANLFDCSYFLRPGLDICLLLSVPSETNSPERSLQSVGVDAKIKSIVRKPHEHGCTCLFNVYLNGEHPQCEIKELCIDNLAILQQLDMKPCEDGYFRWISSRDCRSRTVTKLFRRQFMHDISWLLVASSLKEVEFEISSVKNKILYRVVSGETDTLSFRDDKIVKAINFKVDSGGLRANTATFVLDIAVETALIEGIEEDGTSKCSLDDPMLRRSERRNIQPERYVGDNFFSKGRSWAANQKAKQYEDHKSSSIFLSEPDSDSSTDSQVSECTSGIESDEFTSGIESEGNAILSEAELFDVKVTSKDSHCSEFNSRDKSIRKATPNKTELFDVKRTSTRSHYTEGTSINDSGSNAVASKTESFGVRVTSVHSHCSKGTNRNVSIRTGISRKSKVCDVAGTTINGTTQRKRSRNDKVSFEQVQHSDHVSKQINKRLKSSLASSATSTHICEDTVLNQQNHLANRAEKGSTTSSKCVKSRPKHRKDTIGRSGKDVKKRFGMKISGQEFKSKLSVKSREKGPYGIRKTTLLRKSEYSRIIGECMMNIDVGRLKHQQPAVDQWEEIMSNQWWKLPQEPPASDLVENSELEDLWKEMEMSMHSLQFPEENETADDGTLNNSRVDDDKTCEHDYILDEQIGTICRLCRSIGTEIRHILPTFIQKPCKIYVQNDEIKFEGRGSDGDLEFNMLDKPAPSRDASILEANASVWALIPDLRSKLHAHQKNAFEFLWKNIAGSLMPADMDAAIGRTGGCIISHSPGAGKTFLIISFLVSYLKLYPGKRPLILAPKTTLHTWYKEFKKWEVSVPLYLIHARKEYRRETRDQKMRASSGDFTLNKNIMHTVDCLQKFEKWHEHASVLLMSYPSFTTIMKKNSGVEHLNYMARILRKSPGLLILDEGHNPRSTESVLRKILMRVKTEHRILLSGTLFQNNFEEYFNTLSLARPRFINEVLMKLSPKTKGYQYVRECTRDVQEMRARKFFLETVARSISSKVNEERVKGLNILKSITGEFIDIYESGTSHSLPGLKSCKILMRPSVMQQEYLATLQKNVTCQRFFLKLQALVTYASIHPWLIKCSPYSHQCYSVKELKKLGSCKMDVRMGSKVSFVVNLVSRCFIKKEKVLIFCRYKEPINLFVEIFKKRFGWNKDDQVLVLNGEQELFERSRVIDKFEEPRGSSQVLLASIAACSEGISLTAASRVVLLDSEWNPSKSKQAVARAFRPGQEKMVYVYQLLASGTLEEDKYGKNTWKESLSKMILVGSGTEDRSCRQKEDVDDEVLKEIMDEDCGRLIHGITRDDKWSFGS